MAVSHFCFLNAASANKHQTLISRITKGQEKRSVPVTSRLGEEAEEACVV